MPILLLAATPSEDWVLKCPPTTLAYPLTGAMSARCGEDTNSDETAVLGLLALTVATGALSCNSVNFAMNQEMLGTDMTWSTFRSERLSSEPIRARTRCRRTGAFNV
jgi:hypothetical protein